MAKIVTVLTDFGNTDPYSAIMKGVMLCINSRLQIVDLTNDIPPYNLTTAAYLLNAAWDYFPPETTFLAVVDPGVGSEREVLVTECEGKYLICPDNGLVTILNLYKRNIKHYRIPQSTINNMKIAGSNTFHGRDIFAPLAANICTYGLNILTSKTEVTPVLLDSVNSIVDYYKKTITGSILHIDHFGNCITSIHRNDLVELEISDNVELYCHGHTLHGLQQCFSDVKKGHPLCYLGSSDFVEIAIREGNAHKGFKIDYKTPVLLKKAKF